MAAHENLSEQMDAYRFSHQPDPEGSPAHDLTGDYSKAYEHRWGNDPASRESVGVLHSIRGNPDAEVSVYRAAPPHVEDIQAGNWVSLSRKYAEGHAESRSGESGGEYRVLEKKVPAHEVRWEANDINEFGWFPKGS
jgi:hypothetical protein